LVRAEEAKGSKRRGEQGINLQEVKARFVQPRVKPLLKEVNALIFDVDGVLLDVHQSFWNVILLTTKKYLELLSIKSPFSPRKYHIKLLKMAGGFNNDWDVTSALIIISLSYAFNHPLNLREIGEEIYKRGGGLNQLEALLQEKIPNDFPTIRSLLDKSLVERLFKEIYAGKDTPIVYGFQPKFIYPEQEGLYKNEIPLLKPEDIPPFIEKIALFTGRTAGETLLALKMTGFSSLIPQEYILTADDGLNKPDEKKLKELANKLGAKVAIYVGDAIDDLRSVPKDDSSILSCIVQKRNTQIFKKEGADIIVPDTISLIQLLKEERSEGK
jgi:phosphoglycolate phosphatase-like HAD superfamily hydrolase